MNLQRFFLTTVLVAFTLLTVNGCRYFLITPLEASQIKFTGPLIVAMHENLQAYSLEKDLITDFARSRKIKIKFVSFKTAADASDLLYSEKVDLVFSRMPQSVAFFPGHFSMVYDDLKLSVLCSGPLTKSSTLYIPEIYMYTAQSDSFLKKFTGVWRSSTAISENELRALSLNQSGVCYLSDARQAARNVLLYPALQVVWTAGTKDAVSWVTRHDLAELNQLMHAWFQNLVRKKQIRKFWDRYDSVDFKMSVLAQRRFQKDVNKKLPQWRKLFEKNGTENQIPWTLVAAVAYQESKWSNDAVSHTGVKGLMQLTRNTAKHLGINDREDPKESVRGGAFYLKYLYDKTSNELQPYERWAQALSAYNMGWAHLRDARRLAKKLGKDSNRWCEFKTVIPLLAQKKYLTELTFGPARGEETVDFVEQVIGYNDLLNSTFIRRSPTSQDF